MRFTAREVMSEENSWSRKTVSPSFNVSWNQSRQDSIACPIVEVLVRDHGFDRLVLVVGCGLGLRQHVLRVEDVESLVLHRPHVEVADGDDIEHFEVVLPAEALLVPAHGELERLHGPGTAILLAVLDIYIERHLAA